MAALKRSEYQVTVDHFRSTIEPYMNRAVRITFDRHSADTIIEEMYLAKTTGFLNAPDMRQGADKMYTPGVFIIKTKEAELAFVIEDTNIVAIIDGFRITIGQTVVEVRGT